MNLPLRVLLGYFLIVGLAAFFVLRIFVAEVRPSVKQAIEEASMMYQTLVFSFSCS